MRVTDEKLYHLFNEYDPDCWFCTPEEAAEARRNPSPWPSIPRQEK